MEREKKKSILEVQPGPEVGIEHTTVVSAHDATGLLPAMPYPVQVGEEDKPIKKKKKKK